MCHIQSYFDEAVGLMNKFTIEGIDPYSEEAFKMRFDNGLHIINKFSFTEKYDFVVGIYGLMLLITHFDNHCLYRRNKNSLDIIKYFIDKLNLQVA